MIKEPPPRFQQVREKIFDTTPKNIQVIFLSKNVLEQQKNVKYCHIEFRSLMGPFGFWLKMAGFYLNFDQILSDFESENVIFWLQKVSLNCNVEKIPPDQIFGGVLHRICHGWLQLKEFSFDSWAIKRSFWALWTSSLKALWVVQKWRPSWKKNLVTQFP